jgi:ubiquinone/menaquinone biosynthesis C-methylase UbiE
MIDLVAVYARHAQSFDRARAGASMERPYLDAVTQLAPTPGKVLDVGCGSGEPIARYFVEHGYHVTGVDAVNEMLNIARTRFPEMTWRQQDMRSLDFAEHFNIVIAWDSFFHLSPGDQRLMFEKFRKHTAPRGVLMFTSGLIEGEAVGGDMFGDLLYHASLDTAEYAHRLDGVGYDIVSHSVEDPHCGGRTVWVAQLREMDSERA